MNSHAHIKNILLILIAEYPFTSGRKTALSKGRSQYNAEGRKLKKRKIRERRTRRGRKKREGRREHRALSTEHRA